MKHSTPSGQAPLTPGSSLPGTSIQTLIPDVTQRTDRVLNTILGPDDWLGRHQGLCLALLAALITIAPGVIEWLL